MKIADLIRCRMILLLLSFSCFSAFAQEVAVSGRVIDAGTKEAVPFATVTIHRKDSTLLTGGVTDNEGLFSIRINRSDALRSEYLVRVSCVGYRGYVGTLNASFTEISLPPDETMLDEILVTGVSKPVKMSPSGNLVANVAGTYLSKRLDMSDLLSSIPGLLKDRGHITTIHGVTPLFIINGRRARSLTEVSNLNVKDIEHIEVNHNPGSEYEGGVQAVVIIQTVKPLKGFAINIRSEAKRSRVWSHREELNASYAFGKAVLYGSLGYEDMGKKSIQDITRALVRPDGTEDFYLRNQLVSYPSHGKMLTYSLGLDYQIGKDHNLSVSWNGYGSGVSDIGVAQNEVKNRLGEVSRFESTSDLSEKSSFGHLAANYLFSNDKGVKFSLGFDYASTGGARTQTTSEEIESTERSIVSTNHFHNRLLSVIPSLTVPIGAHFSLTTGGQFDWIQNQNDLAYSDDLSSRLSNSHELLGAAFLGLSYKRERFNAQAGVRFEHNQYRHKEGKEEEKQISNQVLPYGSISFSLGETYHQISYKHFINRPRLGFMGGYSYYLNRFSRQEGNPKLRPESTHTFSYALMWKKIYLSANYDYVQNPITALSYFSPETEEGLVVNSWHNLSKRHIVTAMLNYSDAFDWYRPSLTLAYLWHINYVESIPGTTETLSHPVPYVQFQNAFALPWFDAHIDYQFFGKGYFSVFLTNPRHILNLSVSKKWFNDTLTISLYWNDVFRKDISQYATRYRGLLFTQREDQDLSGVGLTIQYRFNEKKTQDITSSDQLNRL